MSDFLSKSSSPFSDNDMAARKDAVMQNIRQELALANAQELMNKATEKCFSKCVTKPGSSLGSAEQTCLSRCLERYLETFNVVSRAYHTRVGKERLQEGRHGGVDGPF
ncbi:hypothetical protein M413DRAFT_446607 [Hebeloma cylindrosporum]|uniref:Mitochondrial import inner membrane translocase subunit n=1 Tax=Hebeloma cylindrosporum TaxID=76867 RepID=A0A0C3C635_HEBCY|nr:hypothetical protein M413DRAFT_446607 [Hebeloma cylindrosporum h7]